MPYEVVQRVCPPLKPAKVAGTNREQVGSKLVAEPKVPEKMLRHAPQNKDAAKQRRNK